MDGVAASIHPEAGYATPVPAQLIVGELDGTGDIRESMAAWAEQEQDVEYHVGGGAGHCANLDRPDEVNRLVFAFLERHLLPPLQTRGE
jgi:pimeloyl-ACP methyl ester carboxylesterase